MLLTNRHPKFKPFHRSRLSRNSVRHIDQFHISLLFYRPPSPSATHPFITRTHTLISRQLRNGFPLPNLYERDCIRFEKFNDFWSKTWRCRDSIFLDPKVGGIASLRKDSHGRKDLKRRIRTCCLQTLTKIFRMFHLSLPLFIDILMAHSQ